MSCSNYLNSVSRLRNQMRYPVDNHSLYAKRIYDNQTALRRAYEADPVFSVNYIEAFGSRCPWNKILKLAVIILLVFAIVVFAKDFQINPVQGGFKTVSLNVEPATPLAPELSLLNK